MAPAPADAFVDSAGAVTHFNYGGTPYVDSFTTVANALVASGIRHVRDGEPGDLHPQALTYLGRRGVRHSVLYPIDTTRDQIVTALRAYAPYVDFVEPANEWDIKGRNIPNWAEQWRDEQRLLYTTVRSDPANAAITIVGPAPGRLGLAATLGSLDQYEDVGALHHYPCSLNPGASHNSVSFPAVLAQVRHITVDKPIWTTEVGYADDAADMRCGLPDAVIAKYDPRLLAERWLAGERRTYFYQFADMDGARGYNSMGFVTVEGAPKPQYAALASMLHLLTDPGSRPDLLPLAYGLAGDTDNVHQLLLEKHGRTYVLMLWLEVPSWNPFTRTTIAVAPQTVRLTLPAAPVRAVRYAYTSDWNLAPHDVPAQKTLDLPVDDSISFVELQY
jgi:hypothetical protein